MQFGSLVSIVLLGVLVWIASLTFWLYRTVSHYRRLTRGVVAGDLQAILEEYISQAKIVGEELSRLKRVVADIVEGDKHHLQRWAIKRFNPFEDTGGEQSFVLGLFSDKGDGAIISCLHSRSVTRIFAKQVTGWESDRHGFSKEETQLIDKVKNQDT